MCPHHGSPVGSRHMEEIRAEFNSHPEHGIIQSSLDGPSRLSGPDGYKSGQKEREVK